MNRIEKRTGRLHEWALTRLPAYRIYYMERRLGTTRRGALYAFNPFRKRPVLTAAETGDHADFIARIERPNG